MTTITSNFEKSYHFNNDKIVECNGEDKYNVSDR